MCGYIVPSDGKASWAWVISKICWICILLVIISAAALPGTGETGGYFVLDVSQLALCSLFVHRPFSQRASRPVRRKAGTSGRRTK